LQEFAHKEFVGASRLFWWSVRNISLSELTISNLIFTLNLLYFYCITFSVAVFAMENDCVVLHTALRISEWCNWPKRTGGGGQLPKCL